MFTLSPIEGEIYRKLTLKLCRVFLLIIQLKYLPVLLYEEITQGQENHLNGLEVTVLGSPTELRLVPIPTAQNILPIENFMIHEEFGKKTQKNLTQY